MSKAKMVTSPNRMPSIPGGNSSRPSGSSPIATSNDPDLFAFAVRFGNRATKCLAKQKLKSSKYQNFIKKELEVQHD